MAAALQLASITILPMLSFRLCRDAFFDGDVDVDDVTVVWASSDEATAVVSSSTGVVGDVADVVCRNNGFLISKRQHFVKVSLV
jgi:hypothetical protein